MIEIAAPIIGGVFLLANTYLSYRTRKDLATQNGHKPGHMIEATYDLVKLHIDDEEIHRRE